MFPLYSRRLSPQTERRLTSSIRRRGGCAYLYMRYTYCSRARTRRIIYYYLTRLVIIIIILRTYYYYYFVYIIITIRDEQDIPI